MTIPSQTASPEQTSLAAAAILEECRLIASMSEEPGRITRRFLTPPVSQVYARLRSQMLEVGMTVSVDSAGNLRGLWQPKGAGPRRMVLGSHIDTVPDAGAYDGVLGVVMAIELARQAVANSLPLAIEIIAFSEEEGVRFGVPFLGSRAVAGRFDPALLALRDAEGVSLNQAILDFGLDPGGLPQAQIGEDTIGFLEIHIEQGPVLEAENLSLGVVTGIVGQTRCELQFLGHANHAGTTPMTLRHDALAAAAEWICAVEEIARRPVLNPPLLGDHAEAALVATVGKVATHPNAANVIPGAVHVSLDVRAAHDAVREEAVAELLEKASSIAMRRGIECESKRLMDQPAVPMDEQLTAVLAECVEAAGLPVRRMPSGAGHDAMVLGTRLPAAMLFLQSPGGVSHHPNESVRPHDIDTALTVGSLFLRRLALKIV